MRAGMELARGEVFTGVMHILPNYPGLMQLLWEIFNSNTASSTRLQPNTGISELTGANMPTENYFEYRNHTRGHRAGILGPIRSRSTFQNQPERFSMNTNSCSKATAVLTTWTENSVSVNLRFVECLVLCDDRATSALYYSCQPLMSLTSSARKTKNLVRKMQQIYTKVDSSLHT